nr:hypothetical protein [Bacteroidota bacterium]
MPKKVKIKSTAKPKNADKKIKDEINEIIEITEGQNEALGRIIERNKIGN